MIERYEHIQSDASDTWIVRHGLKTRTPIVDAYIRRDGSYHKVQPLSVRMVDLDTLEVKWSVPRTGRIGVL